MKFRRQKKLEIPQVIDTKPKSSCNDFKKMHELRPWLKEPNKCLHCDRKGTFGHYETQFDEVAAPLT